MGPLTVVRVAACVLALATAARAFADGVPIIIPGPALKANDPTPPQFNATTVPAFVKLHPIILVPAAFGANVLNVTIDGKEYRFVGSMMPPPPPPPKTAPKQSPSSTWWGKEPGGGLISLTKFHDINKVYGVIELPPARRFSIEAIATSSVLVETDRNVPWKITTYPATPASSVPSR